jgi:hypothetical protein
MLGTQENAPPDLGGAGVLSADLHINAGSPFFNLNAGAMLSFPYLHTWLATPFDDHITIATDCCVGFSHAVLRAGGSDAVFFANLYGTHRHCECRCTCDGGC